MGNVNEHASGKKVSSRPAKPTDYPSKKVDDFDEKNSTPSTVEEPPTAEESSSLSSDSSTQKASELNEREQETDGLVFPFAAPANSSDAFASSPNDTLSPPIRHSLLPSSDSDDLDIGVATPLQDDDSDGVDTSLDISYARLKELTDCSALILPDLPAYSGECNASNSPTSGSNANPRLAKTVADNLLDETSASNSTPSDSLNILPVTTYAEATNLAARFPKFATEILDHPLSAKVVDAAMIPQPQSVDTGLCAHLKDKEKHALVSSGSTHAGQGCPVEQLPSVRPHPLHTADSPNWALAPMPLPDTSLHKSMLRKKRGNQGAENNDRNNSVRGRRASRDSSNQRRQSSGPSVQIIPDGHERDATSKAHRRSRSGRRQMSRRAVTETDVPPSRRTYVISEHDERFVSRDQGISSDAQPNFPHTSSSIHPRHSRLSSFHADADRHFQATVDRFSLSPTKAQDEALAALFQAALSTQPLDQKASAPVNGPTRLDTNISADSKADMATWLAMASSPTTPPSSFSTPREIDHSSHLMTPSNEGTRGDRNRRGSLAVENSWHPRRTADGSGGATDNHSHPRAAPRHNETPAGATDNGWHLSPTVANSSRAPRAFDANLQLHSAVDCSPESRGVIYNNWRLHPAVSSHPRDELKAPDGFTSGHGDILFREIYPRANNTNASDLGERKWASADRLQASGPPLDSANQRAAPKTTLDYDSVGKTGRPIYSSQQPRPMNHSTGLPLQGYSTFSAPTNNQHRSKGDRFGDHIGSQSTSTVSPARRVWEGANEGASTGWDSAGAAREGRRGGRW